MYFHMWMRRIPYQQKTTHCPRHVQFVFGKMPILDSGAIIVKQIFQQHDLESWEFQEPFRFHSQRSVSWQIILIHVKVLWQNISMRFPFEMSDLSSLPPWAEIRVLAKAGRGRGSQILESGPTTCGMQNSKYWVSQDFMLVCDTVGYIHAETETSCVHLEFICIYDTGIRPTYPRNTEIKNQKTVLWKTMIACAVSLLRDNHTRSVRLHVLFLQQSTLTSKCSLSVTNIIRITLKEQCE